MEDVSDGIRRKIMDAIRMRFDWTVAMSVLGFITDGQLGRAVVMPLL